MAKSINAKSTKAEILEVLEEVQQEKAVLESQVKSLSKSVKNAESQTVVKEVEKPAMKPQTTIQPSIAQVIEGLEKLQISFGSAVSNLSEQLIGEATTLEDLQSSVDETLEQLAELHDLETVEEETLGELIEEYQESYKNFDQEFNQQKETLETELQDLKKSWQKEQENHKLEIKDRDDNYKQSYQRDEEEYRYNLNLERNLDREEYEQEKRALYQELAEIRQVQEQQWLTREETIAQQEKAQALAKAAVEAFEKELEAKIKQGTDEGKGIGFYQAKVKADLRSKEVEGEKRNFELKIASLNQNIQNQEARIQALTKQLDAALKQVQDLAVKAIEGSSNRSSFEAMKEIAIEQAKNQPKNK
jgi:hypothetical protein